MRRSTPPKSPFAKLRAASRRGGTAFTLIELSFDGPRTVRKRKSAAFTLIELLVVIAIISLLVGILVPTVQMAIRQAHNARSMARIQELGQGCEMYHKDYEYYPGQWRPDLLKGSTPPGGLTGSFILALRLFTDVSATPQFPQPKYAPIKPADDLKKFPPDATGIDNTPTDRMPVPLPVLYYPARLGETGLNQYKEDDNAIYVEGNTDITSLSFSQFITDRRFQDYAEHAPANPGTFLLIGAGLDRKYFTGDDICYPDWRNK